MHAKQRSTKTAKPVEWHTGTAVAELIGESNRGKTSAAMAMGTTLTTLYRWLRSPKWPQRNLDKAAAYLGVSVQWLRTGQGERYVAPTGGTDPRDRQAEAAYLRYELQLQTLAKNYTRTLARIYAGDAKPLKSPKEPERFWTTRESDDV